MDDGAKITAKQLWRTGKLRSDAKNEETGNLADDPNCRYGSLQWLPHPLRGLQRLKHLTVDTDLPPSFPHSPDYPSTVESTPSPSSDTPDYFDLCGDSLLPPVKVDDDMRFRRYPHILIYDLEHSDDVYARDLHSRFSVSWDAGDDSDASESSDESTDHIAFSGQPESIPPELELGIWQFDPPEHSPFALDFPEDVGESLEQDTILTDGDPVVIDRPGQPTPVPASDIPVELSVQHREDSPTLSAFAPNIFLPRVRKLSEDSRGLESLPHLPYPEFDVTGVPINVPVSPFITGGFPDDTTPLYSDLVGGEVEEMLVDADWLGPGSWRETIWSSCLEEDIMGWDRWRRQVIDELNRDLDSWAEVRESVRAELDRF